MRRTKRITIITAAVTIGPRTSPIPANKTQDGIQPDAVLFFRKERVVAPGRKLRAFVAKKCNSQEQKEKDDSIFLSSLYF